MKTLKFKNNKNKVKLEKTNIFSKKEIKHLNSLLKNILYKKYFDEMSAYIYSYKENSFQISEITYDMLLDTIITETISVKSRFSILSDKENINPT